MSMLHSPRFALVANQNNHLRLASSSGATLDLFILEDDIVRVLVLPNGQLQMPRTWSIAPGGSDVPLEGRDRHDLDGYARPHFKFELYEAFLRIETSKIRLEVALTGGMLSWFVKTQGEWRPVLSDRATQAYNFG
jgi:alpha-glucosidase